VTTGCGISHKNPKTQNIQHKVLQIFHIKYSDVIPNTLYIYIYISFFVFDSTALVGLGLLIVEVPLSHSVSHTTLGRTPLNE
jgi:hypothetical protein